MRFLSVCSGIESASVAWGPLGWEAVGVAEIAPFPSALLAERFPNVTNYGDLTRFRHWRLPEFRLLIGGTPCQGFSDAGHGRGLDDERSRLVFEYLGIIEKYRPGWLVWENVPGVLTTHGGRDFGAVLGRLEKLGYGCAWRTLNARYFGVPQQRQRVFVVGYFGDWRPAAAVLFERESLQGHPAPGEKSRENIAGTLAARASASGLGTDFDLDGGLLSRALLSSQQRGDLETQTFVFSGGSKPQTNTLEASGTLKASVGRSLHSGGLPCIYRTSGNSGVMEQGDKAAALTTGTDPNAQILTGRSGVRRLTPLECERLMGFPDHWTLLQSWSNSARRRRGIDYEESITWLARLGVPEAEAVELAHSPDGPRYTALGNSKVVQVVRWIGERIQAVENLISARGK